MKHLIQVEEDCMTKKEAETDLFVYDLLKEAGITVNAQGSIIKEVDEALKTASKKGTGNVGYPEYVGKIKDFLIVIEDKADVAKHIKNEGSVIAQDTDAVVNYAVNGALFYAKHLIENTSIKEIFAIGVSGDAKHHRITPVFVNTTTDYKQLPDVESFIAFNADRWHYFHEGLKNKDISQMIKHVNRPQVSKNRNDWARQTLKEIPLVNGWH